MSLIIIFTAFILQGLFPVNSFGQEKRVPENAVVIDYKGGMVHLPMIINDTVACNLLFDTGASSLSIDSTAFENHSFINTGKGDIGGSGEGREYAMVIFDSISVRQGDLFLTPQYTVMLGIRKITGKNTDGIIGIDLIRESLFEMNYTEGYVRCVPRSSFDASLYDAIPFDVIKNRIYIPATVNIGDDITIQGNFLYDTRAGGTIVLTSSTAEKYRLPELPINSRKFVASVGGIGGGSSTVSIRIKDILFGGYRLNEPIISYSHNKTGALSDQKYIGIIGNRILERFDPVIDLSGNMLYIKAAPTFEDEFPDGVLSFRLVDRTDITDGYYVTSLEENGPAHKAGLMLNDLVVEIDGQPLANHSNAVEELKKPEKEYTLGVIRNNEKFEITIRNGKPYL